MKIIISPAKKMNVDVDCPSVPEVPLFLHQTGAILERLQSMDDWELQTLWKCNDNLARLNQERLRTMNLDRNLTPAVFSYEGIQYQYMAPRVMEAGQLTYLQDHLRILSGFYGLLRPLDGVTPYRLEMQAKLALDGHKNLYQFWGTILADTLTQETDSILNLASQEYSKAVIPHLPSKVPVVTCTFGEQQGERIVEKGTMCKMARGQMVRWLAEEGIDTLEEVAQFNQLDYCFSKENSTPTQFVFLKESSRRK